MRDITSAAINNIRNTARASLGMPPADRCSTCCRPASAPARREVAGRIVEGCVDAFHVDHADAWFARPAAASIRAATLASLRA